MSDEKTHRACARVFITSVVDHTTQAMVVVRRMRCERAHALTGNAVGAAGMLAIRRCLAHTPRNVGDFPRSGGPLYVFPSGCELVSGLFSGIDRFSVPPSVTAVGVAATWTLQWLRLVKRHITAVYASYGGSRSCGA